MAHVNGITQFLPATHTTILTLLRKHSPDGTTWTKRHPSDIVYYSIYRPQKDERLGWPSWLTYSRRLTHIRGHPSAAGRVWDRKVRRSKTNVLTTVPRNQPDSSEREALRTTADKWNKCLHGGCPCCHGIHRVKSYEGNSKHSSQSGLHHVFFSFFLIFSVFGAVHSIKTALRQSMQIYHLVIYHMSFMHHRTSERGRCFLHWLWICTTLKLFWLFWWQYQWHTKTAVIVRHDRWTTSSIITSNSRWFVSVQIRKAEAAPLPLNDRQSRPFVLKFVYNLYKDLKTHYAVPVTQAEKCATTQRCTIYSKFFT